MRVASTLVMVGLLAFSVPADAQPTNATPGEPSHACEVSTDDTYGYSEANAIQVGGSPMYGAARQRRYLGALRGPDGQAIQYQRIAQARAPDGTILDRYDLSYEGLAAPITLFLDWYHFDAPVAPKGFGCAGPIDVGPPLVDPFRELNDLQAVAVEQGADRDFPPIPLALNGDLTYGVMYDRFRLQALAARAAAREGEPLEADELPVFLARQGAIVVAYPVTCGDRRILPTTIDVITPNGARVQDEEPLSAEAIQRLLSGLRPPDGAIGLSMSVTRPRPNDIVRVSYTEPVCGGPGPQVSLPVAGTWLQAADLPSPLLPEGAPVNRPVLLQAVADTEGRLLRLSYMGGPKELTEAAIDSLNAAWKAVPARINGTPVAVGLLLEVRFQEQ